MIIAVQIVLTAAQYLAVHSAKQDLLVNILVSDHGLAIQKRTDTPCVVAAYHIRSASLEQYTRI